MSCIFSHKKDWECGEKWNEACSLTPKPILKATIVEKSTQDGGMNYRNNITFRELVFKYAISTEESEPNFYVKNE